MVYDLPLEEVKVKPHQITTLHLLCALAFIGTGAIIAVYNYTIPAFGVLLLIAGLALAGITIFKNKWTISNQITPRLRIAELLISVLVVILSLVEHWAKFPAVIFGGLAVAVLFAIYWERTTGGALFIHIDNDGIKLPVTARKRFLAWTEIEQVVLRFGTLTIDCADNRLFQYNITETDADSDILEAYCKAQVAENIEKRRKDDW
jgi:hypothetical protein